MYFSRFAADCFEPGDLPLARSPELDLLPPDGDLDFDFPEELLRLRPSRDLFRLFLPLGAGAAGAGDPVRLLLLPGTGAALNISSDTSSCFLLQSPREYLHGLVRTC